MAREPFNMQVDLRMSNLALEKILITGARDILSRKMEAVCVDAVKNTNDTVRKIFVNDRDGDRRRLRRGRHLLNSFSATAEHGAGKNIISVVLTSSNVPGKVGMLEEGSKKITTQRPRDGKFLFFPSNETRRPLPPNKAGPPAPKKVSGRTNAAYYRVPKKGAEKRFQGTGQLLTKVERATHKPYTGRHFMRNGLRKAIRDNLQR